MVDMIEDDVDVDTVAVVWAVVMGIR